jgi:hypothetical protein
MNTDAIQAGKHFKIDQWARLKHAAFRLAMAEHEPRPEHRDTQKIKRIIARFKLGAPVAFYLQNPELIKP